METAMLDRRAFVGMAGAAVLSAATPAAERHPLGVLAQIRTGDLEVGCFEGGPPAGPAVVLLHGWPYDVHSFAQVAPLLARRGCRVIVPHLRGHGTTRILGGAVARSGQQAALGMDVIALLDALRIDRAVLAGYDWGGRAACVAAALWPERCAGLVSVNGYLIQDIARSGEPTFPATEAAFWYQFYFLTERGRLGLERNRGEIARLMWSRNSPAWEFDEPTFRRSAVAFDNPDYVDVTIHSYRHRLGHAPGHETYAHVENRLAMLPAIGVPAITLDGATDGVVTATDGSRWSGKFTDRRAHRVVPFAGHNLPQEAPEAFAAAVSELVESGKWSP